MSGPPKLGSVAPRERAGSQTGRKYEYQYERTARAALELLSDSVPDGPVAVYCDWHDDFVTELASINGAATSPYIFTQVKGRTSSQGPWNFRDFFGIPFNSEKADASKAHKVSVKAVFPKMVLHHDNFKENCSGLVFITNSGIEPTLLNFMSDIAGSISSKLLPDTSRYAFERLARSYMGANPKIATTDEQLYDRVRSLVISTDQGTVDGGDEHGIREIADIVDLYSEIELSIKQTKQIAREIINLVRRKVSHTTTLVPASDDVLRNDKGIVVENLLPILSLSHRAFKQLKAGSGRDTVKSLSRLQRYCREHGLDKQIVTICTFKAQWDLWRTNERHSLHTADYIVLERRVRDLLHVALPLERLVVEAKNISKDFAGTGISPLTAEHVLGFAFSIVAEDETPA